MDEVEEEAEAEEAAEGVVVVPNLITRVPLAKTGLAKMVCLDRAVHLALEVHLAPVVPLARRAYLETAAAMAMAPTASLEIRRNSDNKRTISAISYSSGYSNSAK